MGELVILDKRKRPAAPGPETAEYVTERVAVPREAFEAFARGEQHRAPREFVPTEAQRRAAQRAWADQAAATLWWSAQRAGQQGRPALADKILAKRAELRDTVAAQLGEVWV